QLVSKTNAHADGEAQSSRLHPTALRHPGLFFCPENHGRADDATASRSRDTRRTRERMRHEDQLQKRANGDEGSGEDDGKAAGQNIRSVSVSLLRWMAHR